MLDELDESQMLAQAGASNDIASPLTRCEGLLFGAQYRLLAGQSEGAIELFMRVLEIKAIDVCDHTIAIVELRRPSVNLLPAEKQIDIRGGGQ